MDSAELVGQAAAELYGCDPAEFTSRRAELAARARAAGDRAAAKQIADLRKPTRSAWVVNQLARADPAAPTQLAALAAEFKAAQVVADGAAMRRLSQQRRTLIDALVRQALAASNEDEPSATLREEVTATLAAALADTGVAERLAAGTLTRAEQRAEFGSLADEPVQPPAARGQAPDAETARTPDTESQAPDAKARAADAERAARAERQRQQAIANAEQAVENARQAADAAAQAEREHEQTVKLLEEELAQARLRLQQARLLTRQATDVHTNATRALQRARKSIP
jgi:hypothetical protein